MSLKLISNFQQREDNIKRYNLDDLPPIVALSMSLWNGQLGIGHFGMPQASIFFFIPLATSPNILWFQCPRIRRSFQVRYEHCS